MTTAPPKSHHWHYAVDNKKDPLEAIKRGVPTTIIEAKWRISQPGDGELARKLHPKLGPTSPSVLIAGRIHLTSVGWRRVRLSVKKAIEKRIANGKMWGPFFSFRKFEISLRPSLETADRAVTAGEYEEDLGIKFPYLLLVPQLHAATGLADKQSRIININHQSGGLLCIQRRYRGIVLRPNKRARALAERLNAEFDDTSITAPATWETLCRYQDILKDAKLASTDQYMDMEESVYPLSEANLSSLTSQRLPANRSTLLDWDPLYLKELTRQQKRFHEMFRRNFHWKLYLITENSD